MGTLTVERQWPLPLASCLQHPPLTGSYAAAARKLHHFPPYPCKYSHRAGLDLSSDSCKRKHASSLCRDSGYRPGAVTAYRRWPGRQRAVFGVEGRGCLRMKERKESCRGKEQRDGIREVVCIL